MNFKLLVFSKLMAIIPLINIAPLIFPQTALVIFILALTNNIAAVFSQQPYLRGLELWSMGKNLFRHSLFETFTNSLA